MQKKSLSERDICTKFITPAIEQAGWNRHTQYLEEVSFTDGKIYVKGTLTARGTKKRADYILYYKPNIPIAIIEAKDNNHSIGAGIQQGLEYAQTLDIPFIFSSNGDGFLFHDKSAVAGDIEVELKLDEFPSPEELWVKYKVLKGIVSQEVEKIVAQDYYFDGSNRRPRYYQQIAINDIVKGFLALKEPFFYQSWVYIIHNASMDYIRQIPLDKNWNWDEIKEKMCFFNKANGIIKLTDILN